MEGFKVVLTKTAARDAETLDPKTWLDILREVAELKRRPFPDGHSIKKIKGTRNSLYRLRVGDFRAIYRIDGHVVTILMIVDRKDLEKAIKIITR